MKYAKFLGNVYFGWLHRKSIKICLLFLKLMTNMFSVDLYLRCVFMSFSVRWIWQNFERIQLNTLIHICDDLKSTYNYLIKRIYVKKIPRFYGLFLYIEKNVFFCFLSE